MRSTRLGGVVLIIEGDDSLRRMIGAVLRRTGFRVHLVSEVEAAEGVLARERVDVIVRDVRARRELAATPAGVLRKTIVATTGKGIDAATVFAVVRKPFDVEELVRLVTACAWRTREERLAPRMSLDALRRFVSSVPSLRRALAEERPSAPEMLLRIEMRRAILALSDALHEASRIERNRTRAAAFLAASMVAEELARPPVAKRCAARAQH
ncbi:MAG TPA: hypothetical protein VF266_12655 [Thermoanaerobaculia bacterium]